MLYIHIKVQRYLFKFPRVGDVRGIRTRMALRLAHPSAVPLSIDLRNISKGWFRQISRIIKQTGMSVPAEMWDYDKIKSLSNDEYEAIKPLIYKLFEEKAPEYYHIICGQTPP